MVAQIAAQATVETPNKESAAEATEVWTEDQVKALLRQRGLKTPPGTLLAPGEPLLPLGHPFPVAVKVCSPEVLHKTDVGGVVLDVKDPAALAEAVAVMRRRFPDQPLLVESMEQKGVEVIVGVVREPSFGPCIMLGLGGTLAELYKDVTFRLLPISRADAEGMLEDLKGRALLEGFRGAQVDRTALVDLLLAVGSLAESLGDRLAQMDLNPVFARASDAVVVDAKVVLQNK